MATVNLLLFGDGTVDPVACIKELDQDAKRSATLQTFLRTTAAALRAELAKSSSPATNFYPKLESIIGLAECECERGSSQCNITSSNPTCCVGLCNGMFAAAAAATCRSLNDLLTVAPAIVCLNMRLMFAAIDRSLAIEKSRETWTIVTPGVTSKEHDVCIANWVHHNETMPHARRVYISCISDTFTTVSGPPSSLANYFGSCEELKATKKINTPINGMYHAPHLWRPDFHAILGGDMVWNTFATKPNVSLLSISTGRAFSSGDLESLLLLSMEEVLSKTFRWDLVMRELCLNLKSSYSHATIQSVGPDRVAIGVQRALSDVGVDTTIAELSRQPIVPLLPSADDIAIVGVGARLPGADSLEGIWNLIREGQDTHGPIPSDRSSIDEFALAQFGCFLDKPGFFDAKMFKMSPREASQTDPGQRLALLTTYEALEMAGYAPNSCPAFSSERIASFWGQTLDDYRDTEAAQDVDIYYVTGGTRAFGPGRINYHFKWQGPSMSVDTACSSSAVAVQLAVQSLRSGECDLAVAGGSNIITSPSMYAGLSKGGFLSRTGGCKTFDQGADGYCRGEGVGTVVLKRLRDASADHDKVLAVIKSCSTNHSAFADSITRPEGNAQIKVLQHALTEAGVQAHEIDYVEMHGTGTQVGDRTEFSSAAQVLRVGKNKRDKPVYVGSIKANVGHGEGAAGINSLVKIILMLQHNELPPHIGVKGQLNQNFATSDLETISINRTLKPFPKTKETRKLALHSFDAAGGNTAIIIEDPPPVSERPLDPRKYHIVAISGHTSGACLENQRKLARYIREHPQIRISDLAYTTTARRMHHSHRKSYITEDVPQLLRLINNGGTPNSKIRRHIIFTFTGQGSHHLSAARELLISCETFRNKLQQCENICQNQGLPSFMNLIKDASAPESHIAAFQISILAIQIALVATLEAWGISAHAVIGHSIGEYAALTTAGVLDEVDALYLVGSRAQQIERLCKCGEWSMLSASVPLETTQQMLTDPKFTDCVVACNNSPSSVVISGPVASVSRLAKAFAARKIPNKLLDLDFGFHSPQFKDISLRLCTLGQGVHFHKPRIPVASTYHGKVVCTDGVFDANYIASQTTGPVMYKDALEALEAHFGEHVTKNAVWFEIGTNPTCGSMVVSTLQVPMDSILCTLRKNEHPWQSVSKALACTYDLGIDVDWANFHKEHHACLSVIELPRYSFDLRNHWIPYIQGGGARKEDQPSVPKIDPRLAPFHYRTHQTVSKAEATVQFACILSDPKLSESIRGHLVEGVGLCPASVYADLAFHAAAQLLDQVFPHAHGPRAMDLSKVNIVSPLFLAEDHHESTLLVDATWVAKESQDVRITFSSSVQSTEVKAHCNCVVLIGNAEHWKEQWQEHQYLIQSRIDHLNGPGPRPIHTMYSQMIYTLFASAIVDYSDPYRVIKRMAIEYECMEAVAELEIPQKTANSTHSPGPYCLDAVMHMAGFILNSNPQYPANTVFIANGWKSLRFSESLQPARSYVCHTRMDVSGDTTNVFVGNVTILSHGRIIGACRGLTFHKLSRKSLQRLLGVRLTSKPRITASKSMDKMPCLRPKDLSDSVSFDKGRSSASELSDNTMAKVLKILSTETNVPISDLHDQMLLSELGVDSLLSISLLRQLGTALKTELPANTLSSCETVGRLKQCICAQLQDSGTHLQNSSSTHETQSKNSGDKDVVPSRPLRRDYEMQSGDALPKANTNSQSKTTILGKIIATEVGISTEEIKAEMTAADLGIDSLLTISIAEVYKTQTGEDLPPAMFYEYHTIGSLFTALDTCSEPDDCSSSSRTENGDKMSSSASSLVEVPSYSCVSMRLQGSEADSGPSLFFLPDGSGSLFSYIHLPKLQPNLAVYALDSPFHKNPENYDLDFAAVATVFKDEIQRIQPTGPYMIAGWSLGGVHAYEVVRQLLEENHTVKHLIMLDSPCPGTLPPLPHASLDLLEKAGIFQGLNQSVGKVADHTRAHFVAVTNSFQHWIHRPLTSDEQSRLHKVSILWAGHGVLEDHEEGSNAWMPGMNQVEMDMLKAKEWLCGERTKFDAGGWEKLTGKEIQCLVIPGNHFSMMFPPVVTEVANVLRNIL